MITDMTTGSPTKILWKFTIPMLISVMFQQLYNIVDSIVAGKFVGVNALAAVDLLHVGDDAVEIALIAVELVDKEYNGLL